MRCIHIKTFRGSYLVMSCLDRKLNRMSMLVFVKTFKYRSILEKLMLLNFVSYKELNSPKSAV